MTIKRGIKAIGALFSTAVLLVSSVLPSAAAISDSTGYSGESGMFVTSRSTYDLAPGITEEELTVNNAEGNNQAQGHAVKVDLSDESTQILVSYKDYMNGLSETPSWGMQSVRDQAAAAEAYYQPANSSFDVVAGINGDFFNMTTGAPIGTFAMQGKVYNINEGWAYFAILKDGTPVIRAGGSDVSDVREAVGGPGIILSGGELTEVAKTGAYGLDQLPRSAVGITADGDVVFFETDGRKDPLNCGMDYFQLAETMRAMGCVEALCLDGGGSSTFLTQRQGSEDFVRRNNPSDGHERTVSSAILIASTAANKSVEGSYHEHSYIYNGSSLICSCGEAVAPAEYTGVAYDSATGLIMYLNKGEAKKNDWLALGNSMYYFGENGLPVTGSRSFGNYTIAFAENGEAAQGALVREGGYYYYYMFAFNQTTGQWEAKRQRGWFLIDGYWYYFDRQHSFRASTGTCRPDIEAVSDAKLYTFSSAGRLTVGGWYDVGQHRAYYWGPNPVTGFAAIEGYTYYFDHATAYMATGFRCIEGSLYYFDAQGHMATGSVTVDDTEYAVGSSGKVAIASASVVIGGKYYSFNDEGQFVDNHISDHPYEQVVNPGTEASCTEDGYFGGEYCAVCTEVTAAAHVIPATGHSFSQWVGSPAATCTQGGIETRACTVCGENETRNVAALGHDFEDFWTVDREATNDEVGEQSHHCSRCDERADITEIPLSEHSYGEWIVTKEPGCTENGLQVRTCGDCGQVETREIRALGHDFEENWTTDRPATGVESGQQSRHCTRCNEVTDIVEIPKLDVNDKLEISGEGITVNETTRHIILPEKNTASNIRSLVGNEHVSFLSFDGSELPETAILGTGCRIRILDSAGNAVSEYMVIVRYDANGDGSVNAADARIALRASARLVQMDGVYITAVDVNGDGKISASDARQILRISAHLA